MEAKVSSPSSASTSPASFTGRRRSNLSLDLSDLPPLSQPAPPSNTLLITNLQSAEIFASSNLESIHRAIQDQCAIYAFSPLKSLRRIICTFYEVDDAIKIRQLLDGEAVLGDRIRVYFGAETKINPGDQHLQAPKSEKQFLISPPPSPPMGWEMREEDPPNKEVHADDLASALARLHARFDPMQDVEPSSVLTIDTNFARTSSQLSTSGRARSGTGSFIVFSPHEDGHLPDLPAIAVEDTSASPDDLTPMDSTETKFIHTARPPVELMGAS